MNPEIVLRNIQPADLPTVASVHLSAFPESALSSLGRKAVLRYYDWLLSGPHDAISTGAFNNESCFGFCFAGVFRGATSGFLRKNRIFLAKQLLFKPWLVGNPLLRERLRSGIAILRKTNRQKLPSAPQQAVKTLSFGVLAIAVDPQFHGKGLGTLLMTEAEKIARARRFDRMLLTVNPGNLKAICFYEGLGWVRVSNSEQWAGQMTKVL